MVKMLKAALAGALMITVAGCTSTERGAAVGAGTGAVIGAVATGNVKGAAVGGAIGAVSGALIGRAIAPGRCYYRDANGRRFEAPCR
jgi:YMGG-like Gly-zipper